MKTISVFFGCLISVTASAQDASLRYATMPDLPTARALSAQAWAAVQCSPQPACDKAQVTKWVFPIIGLTDGRYAIVLHSGDVYQGEHLVLPNGKTFDLTAGQIAALSTRAGMNTLLGDRVSIATISARITAPQMAAINNYANTHAAFKTNWTALQVGPVDLQAPLIGLVMSELMTAGILTSDQVQTITAPVSTASVP